VAAVDRTIVPARVIEGLPTLDIKLVRESNMGTEVLTDKCDARWSDVVADNRGIGALVTLKRKTVVSLVVPTVFISSSLFVDSVGNLETVTVTVDIEV
jgi:hypothetical protein